MRNGALEIVKLANKLVKVYGTRDPDVIADGLGINVIPMNFKRQKGAYKVMMKNRFIFINNNLQEQMHGIVMWHEIGHDCLHRSEAIQYGGFKEFNLFDMQTNRMEYEANVFAATASLDDEETLDYIMHGYDIGQIAMMMNSDINLVALKADSLIAQGYKFRQQEFRSDFLK